MSGKDADAMPMRMHSFFLLVLFGFGLAESFEMPKGWMMPVDSTFNGAWRKPSPTRYLAAGMDINCDGFGDSILILQPAMGLGIGLFAFLQDSHGSYKPRQLFDSRKDPPDLKGLSLKERNKVQRWYRAFFGIKTVERDIYPTACGLGYRICGKGEKRKIEMECGGIDFFPFDQGGNRYFYWDRKKKKILSAVMSD